MRIEIAPNLNAASEEYRLIGQAIGAAMFELKTLLCKLLAHESMLHDLDTGRAPRHEAPQPSVPDGSALQGNGDASPSVAFSVEPGRDAVIEFLREYLSDVLFEDVIVDGRSWDE